VCSSGAQCHTYVAKRLLQMACASATPTQIAVAGLDRATHVTAVAVAVGTCDTTLYACSYHCNDVMDGSARCRRVRTVFFDLPTACTSRVQSMLHTLRPTCPHTCGWPLRHKGRLEGAAHIHTLTDHAVMGAGVPRCMQSLAMKATRAHPTCDSRRCNSTIYTAELAGSGNRIPSPNSVVTICRVWRVNHQEGAHTVLPP
jgi:hypothetical protein